MKYALMWFHGIKEALDFNSLYFDMVIATNTIIQFTSKLYFRLKGPYKAYSSYSYDIQMR